MAVNKLHREGPPPQHITRTTTLTLFLQQGATDRQTFNGAKARGSRGFNTSLPEAVTVHTLPHRHAVMASEFSLKGWGPEFSPPGRLLKTASDKAPETLLAAENWHVLHRASTPALYSNYTIPDHDVTQDPLFFDVAAVLMVMRSLCVLIDSGGGHHWRPPQWDIKVSQPGNYLS